MAIIIREGSAAGSPVRPDRVYSTGVLAPMSGFDPPDSAQAVLKAFTSGGLGAANLGPLKRLGLRIRAAFAARRAQQFTNLGSPGTSANEAQHIAPQIQHQIHGLERIAVAPAGTAVATAHRGNIFNNRY